MEKKKQGLIERAALKLMLWLGMAIGYVTRAFPVVVFYAGTGAAIDIAVYAVALSFGKVIVWRGTGIVVAIAIRYVGMLWRGENLFSPPVRNMNLYD